MNKKAYYFSIITIILLGLVSLYFASTSRPGYAQEGLSNTQRIQEINDFIALTQEDAKTALNVAGIRGLLAIDEHLITTGNYLDDAQATIKELLINGTINEEKQNLMNISTINNWTTNTRTIASQMRISYELNEQSIQASQEEPWKVKLTLQAMMHVEDEYTETTWNVPLQATANIPLEIINDPIYTIETNQQYRQKILQTPYEDFPTQIQAHIQGHYYIQNSDSPNYLQRLEGRLDATGENTGIQSIIDEEALQEAGYTLQANSHIDTEYFGAITADCTSIEAPSVTITQEHADNYGLSCS